MPVSMYGSGVSMVRMTPQRLGWTTGCVYTQTWDAVSRTTANPTASQLSDNTGQTADTTVEDVPSATAALVDVTAASLSSTNASIAAMERNIADLAAMINKVVADNANLRGLINGLVDDLQTIGIVS